MLALQQLATVQMKATAQIPFELYLFEVSAANENTYLRKQH